MKKCLMNLPIAITMGCAALFSAPLMAQLLVPEAAVESAEITIDATIADAELGDPAITVADQEQSLPDDQALAGEALVDEALVDEALVDEVRQRLIEKLPEFSSAEVTVSSIPGLFEVIADSAIYYVDESTEYLIVGSLIDIASRSNITESRLGKVQMKYIDELDEKDLLIYEPEGEPSGTLTVFTDISCGYCRRLHEELDTLLDAGVRVRYLLFPRAGLGSQGHKDLVSVWCAENPQEAMTNAKAGGKIEPMTCDNPVDMHMELAQQLGLRGTPTMFTNNGGKVPGYRPADVLVEMINDSRPAVQ